MARTALVVVCASLLLPAVARAAPRYATPGGSGTVCSPAAPCDLPTAVSMASTGDEVIVAAGTYNLASGLTPTVDLTIHGSPGPSRPVIVGASGTVPFENDNSKLTLQDLTVESTNADGLRLFGDGSSAERVEVTSSGGNVAIRTGADTVLRDVLAGAGTGGDAVFLQGAAPVSDVTLRNVTAIATGPGSFAVSVFGTMAATSAIIGATNVIADAATDFAASGQNASIQVNHSNFDTSSGTITGSENQTAAPQFLNATAGDYHELPSSPTLDAGVSDPLNGTLDLDGLPRIIGQSTDIGAYELPAAPSNSFRFGKLKRNKRKGIAILTVIVPGPGTLALRGRGLVKQRAARPSLPGRTLAKTVGAAGEVKLKIRSKGQKKRSLNHRGKVKVKARLTYTPTGGTPNTKTKRIKLIKRKR